MLEGNFYISIILNVIFGSMFAYTLYKMSQHNNCELIPIRHVVLKILGSLFAILACLSLVGFIILLNEITFPEIAEPYKTHTMSEMWRRPTYVQMLTLTNLKNIFCCLGISAYFFLFRKSCCKWYNKIGKFFLTLLLCFLYVSSTNFRKFDLGEFIVPVLFFILSILIITRKEKKSNISINGEMPSSIKDEAFLQQEIQSNETFDSKPMSTAINIDQNKEQIDPIQDMLESKVEETPSMKNGNNQEKLKTMYCRFCGHEIESDSLFCKYCGKRLQIDQQTPIQLIIRKCTSFLLLIWASIKRIFHFIKTKCILVKKKIKNHSKGILTTMVLVFSLIIIVGSIMYYFDEIKPKVDAENILSNELNSLNDLEGDTLYEKCIKIIEDHDIPQCGNNKLDYINEEKIIDKAWIKIHKLAKSGNKDAQYTLAYLYRGYDYNRKEWNLERRKDHVKYNSNINLSRAAYWFLQAAIQGHFGAQANIGLCYEKGIGVEENIEQALAWYRTSAFNNNPSGQLKYGDCFRDGCKRLIMPHSYPSEYEIILPQNIDSAMYWWRKSAEQGNEDAKERLEKIY